MKTMRDHLLTLGALCVLALGVVLAQDQAPQAPAPNALPVPAVAVPAPQMPVPNTPPVQEAAAPAPAPQALAAPAVTPSRRPLVLPGRSTTSSRPPFPSRSLSPSSASTLPAPTASSGLSEPQSVGGEPRSKTTTPALKFDNAAVDIILMAYAQETGKTLLLAPDVPKANITLKSQTDTQLTKEEYLEAIEAVLGMNGIVLEPFGDKFVKVLARKTVRTEGIKILMENPEGGHPEKGQVISQMIQLKSIAISEAQKALEGFKKPDGLIQTFERTNSLLVTDTQENVNRMMEIVRFIDQPVTSSEQVFMRTIRFAETDKVLKLLQDLVTESQNQYKTKEEIKANVSGSPGFTRTTTPASPLTRPLPPGLSRLATPQPAPTPNVSLETPLSDADRGMLRGNTLIKADERSHQLIIITSKENMDFLDKIITLVDIETESPADWSYQRLEYSDAEEIAPMLTDLISNKSSGKKEEKAVKGASKNAAGEQPVKSTTLNEAVEAARTTSRPAINTGGSVEGDKNQLGEFGEVTIIADKRTNALLMKGSPKDLAKLKDIIKSIDIQLSQVLIETVVLQVTLKNEITTGIDWVKRVDFGNDNYRYNLSGGGGRNTPNDLSVLDALATNMATKAASGIQYFATLKDLHLDAVITASKSDNATKVLSSPILLTVDNKEATIEATEMRYMYKGMRYMGGYGGYNGGSTGGYGGGSYEPDIEQRDVGLTIKITPRINPSGNVILTVDEKFEDVLGNQTINGQDWPTVTTRKLTADVSVGSGETVILGGLVKTGKTDDSSGIPILKDIPYVGKYLFGKVGESEERSEMLVFLTPYVITSASDMDKETRRRKEYINADGVWTKGWSDSQLADPVSEADMKKRLERTKALQKAWEKYRVGLGEKQEMDARLEEQRTLTQAMSSAKKTSGAPKVGQMNVTETVEVLKPESAGSAVVPREEAEPVRPAVEKPKKAWWKFY